VLEHLVEGGVIGWEEGTVVHETGNVYKTIEAPEGSLGLTFNVAPALAGFLAVLGR
jgi:hypothetical protein